jgi:hypothetical protein
MTFQWMCWDAAAVCSLYPAWLYNGSRIARAPAQGLAGLRDRPTRHHASYNPAPVLTIAPGRPGAQPAPALPDRRA